MYSTINLTVIERVLRRDRMLIAATMMVMIVLSAVYTIAGVGMENSALQMTFGGRMGEAGGSAMSMTAPEGWGVEKVTLIFLMWWVMMIAMMLPSATPTILLHTALLRQTQTNVDPLAHVTVFLVGYLLAWAAFSLTATGLQWWFEAKNIVSALKMSPSRGVAASLLIAAVGACQFLPLKDRCLAQCRSPAEFIARHHRPGIAGAARLGMLHGAVCVGCCFALMVLLFVGGIMNLFWIFGLAALVALEKLTPHGRLIGRVVGVALIVLGISGLGTDTPI